MEKTTASVKVMKSRLEDVKDNALLVGFFKDKVGLRNELKKFDGGIGNIIGSFIQNNDFKGEKCELKGVFINKNIKNAVLVGLGEEEKYSLDVLSKTIADASKKLRDSGTERFSVFLDSFNNGKFKDEEIAEKIIISSLIGLYKFTEYKTKDKDKERYITQITAITGSDKNFNKELEYSSAVAEAVNKTRDLVNTPPNVATPEYVADYAKKIAGKHGLKCTILDEKKIKDMKMGCLMGVAQGSMNKPRLVVLEYYEATTN